jgi:asparagine synthase (glutamine-hydrolysing)
MCGIAGFLGPPAHVDGARDTVRRMADRLRHRGPDGSGQWVSPDGKSALGHRRLAVVDLSPAAQQPMVSACGRFVLALNGEIYNYRELREELSAEVPGWRSNSDTEVLLAAIALLGPRRALDRCVGMFAFAVWDIAEQTLHLARDRLGEKPLYFARFGRHFLFASELKAMRAHPAWSGEVDRDALAQFLRLGYVPGPRSIFSGVHKLTPGTILSTRAGTQGTMMDTFWSAARVIAEHGDANSATTETGAVQQLDRVLGDAVRRQMVADVPVGAFLSGGIDSSLVVALMQKQATRRVKTFSIGYYERQYNEAHHARKVAEHLGTEHTELYVLPKDALAVVPLLPAMYDEPFGDSSQIPTFLVSRLARASVTVALSGDGGDELFCGYTRYVMGNRIMRAMRMLPRSARPVLAGVLRVLGLGAGLLQSSSAVGMPNLGGLQLASRMEKLAEVLRQDGAERVYRTIVAHWPATPPVVGARAPTSGWQDGDGAPDLADPVELMMYLDLVGYLRDDILVKVDRAAMACSLESRMPFLDHRVVEFAWTLPLYLKLNRALTKIPLRRLVERYVPRPLIDRPKMGFGVPIDRWLRGPLREWAEALLDDARIRSEGLLDPVPIRRRWHEHLSGTRNWQQSLWNVLMFQAWYRAKE